MIFTTLLIFRRPKSHQCAIQFGIMLTNVMRLSEKWGAEKAK